MDLIIRSLFIPLLAFIALHSAAMGVVLLVRPAAGIAWSLMIGSLVVWSQFRRKTASESRYRKPWLGWPKGDELSVACAVICSLLLLSSVSALAIYLSPVFDPKTSGAWGKLADDYQKSVGGWVPLMLMTGIVMPMVEELCFRGYIQSRLATGFAPWIAVAITSCVFMLMHLPGAPHWSLLLVSLTLGVTAGVAAVVFGSIWPGILMHCSWNLAMVISANLSSSPPGDLGRSSLAAMTLILLPGLAVGSTGWFWVLRGKLQKLVVKPVQPVGSDDPAPSPDELGDPQFQL